MKSMLVLLTAILLGSAVAMAQTDDAATERAKLANQRIQAEMQRREREEQQRAEAAERVAPQPAAEAEPQRIQQPDQTNQTPPPDRPPVPPAANESVNISEALDQLRTLGELKDAGYVTEDEFARIKKKILDKQF